MLGRITDRVFNAILLSVVILVLGVAGLGLFLSGNEILAIIGVIFLGAVYLLKKRGA